MKTPVPKSSHHLRWNWEVSPESEELIRYHFVVVDDKYREEKIDRILWQFQSVSSGIMRIRHREGKVEDTRYRYLFESYDSSLSPSIIDLTRFALKIQDKELRERKRGSEGIENYVADFYER